MKKLIFLVIIAALNMAAFAQSDKKATAILDEVSVKTYDAYNKPSIVRQKTVIKRDSVINKEKKSGFLSSFNWILPSVWQ